MNEIWKDIKGYEGYYQISNLGRVRSMDRKVKIGEYTRTLKGEILKFGKVRKYKVVTLTKNSTRKYFRVHRLVAIHFIPNPNNYTQVNHKDENPGNNRVDNLEWCTAKYNSNYGTRTQRQSEKIKGKKLSEETKNKISKANKGKKRSKDSINKLAKGHMKKIKCVTTGEVFNSIKEAGIKYDTNHIVECCKGKRKSAGKHPVTGENLIWKYL